MFQSKIKIRHTLAAVPALIFWVVSALFFVIGLSLDDTTGWLFWIAIALAVANTVVQFIGWDSDPGELGPVLYWSWLGSYVLGIGTNLAALISILQIQSAFIEWSVAGALSFLIEVTPERLFVLAWRSLSPKQGSTQTSYQGGESRRRLKKHRGHQELGQTPPGMSRAQYLQKLNEEKQRKEQAQPKPRPRPQAQPQPQTRQQPEVVHAGLFDNGPDDDDLEYFN